MCNIFISWSKSKSRELALNTKYILETLLHNANVFMSEEDIHAGEHVQNAIIYNIEQCDILILCFTSENKKSPWLLYEAGYACGLHKTVIPFLFDKDSLWHSWIDNPMYMTKAIDFNRACFEKDLLETFSLETSLYINSCIKTYKEKFSFEIFRENYIKFYKKTRLLIYFVLLLFSKTNENF